MTSLRFGRKPYPLVSAAVKTKSRPKPLSGFQGANPCGCQRLQRSTLSSDVTSIIDEFPSIAELELLSVAWYNSHISLMREGGKPLQSMTGYGRGCAYMDGREIIIELRTVNHRYLDIAFHTPKGLSFIEDELRSRIAQSSLGRGHIDVQIVYQNNRPDACEISLNEAILDALNKALNKAWQQLEPYKRMSASEALTLSGALTVAHAQENAEAVSALAVEALNQALDVLKRMREREGEHLACDLTENLSRLTTLREQIMLRAPNVPENYRKRLLERLNEWQLSAVDPQRIAQEVAIMADHCAIDEELSRLESHIIQFRHSVEGNEEAGKKLDFLSQEMNREINTIGSKATDTMIAQYVVDAKCIVEKLREQVQNVV